MSLTAKERIQGTGTIAELIRQLDWQRTALGPIDSWSETLVGAVNLMLFSPFPNAIFWGEEATLLYNELYCQILGGKHPQALGSRGQEVWAEAWDTIEPLIHAVMKNGESISARAQLIPIEVCDKLEDRWWTYGMNPIFEGKMIKGVANPVVEDTATVLAERELRRSREEFETGMEAASLGMWHFDPKTGIVTADKRMHRIFGSPVSSSIVNYWLDLVYAEDRERVREHFAGSVAGKHDYDIEYRILRDGEVRWVRSKGNAVGDQSNPERVFAVIEDITDRKQAEATVQQSEKLAAVGRLASTIAHEINNPLESVTNLLYLIQSSQNVADIHSYCETAERELRRVSLIAKQTLRFHRQSTKAAPAYCYDLIGETLELYQGRIVNNRITVEKRKRALKPVLCMSGEIRQVLSNLMVNAIDAMPSGGRLILRSREMTNQQTGKKGLVLTVADTGLGMSSVVKQKVFDAFYTTKGIGGTGLGLWISKEIVERHGGTLRFRTCDAPGKSGTVFNVFLPHAADTSL